MKVMRIFLAFAIAFGSPIFVAAQELHVPSTPTNYVTDRVSALDAQNKSRLEAELRDYAKATGNEVIIYITGSTGGVPLEDWTAQTAHAWKIGHAKKDNGAVLFLFVKDHRVRIEVGYGLESALTDADSKRIIDDDIVPRMRKGDTDAAVTSGVNGVLHQISPDYKMPDTTSPSAKADDDNKLDLKTILIAIAALGVFILFWFAGSSGDSDYRSDGSSGSGGGGDSGGGDSSSDGGDFGGGGASGSW